MLAPFSVLLLLLIVTCVCVQLQEFIDTYRMSNEQILRLSETICDTPMIVIRPNYTYMLDELQADLVKCRYEIRFLLSV